MSESKQSRHPVRVHNVRILRRVASQHGIAPVPDNAARKRVEKLGEDLLAVQLEESDTQAVRQALKDYQATFKTAEVSGEAEGPKGGVRPETGESQREWKFSAVQLTIGLACSRHFCYHGTSFSRASPLACLLALGQAVSQVRDRSIGALYLRRHTATCGAE